ncbi:EF-hand domain-containing family member C2 [Cololabis saira]|uniref:EF-hand domain-containing family member C2 n=1 Tax=Cololabis saira TaxID=129043 RepID=UPI002AD3B2D8|nr:EF-hand domain-containing family member C2 [Cololabis saira]
MALPFLPGSSRNTHLGQEKFHKSQHFDHSNGIPMLVGSEKPGIGGERLEGQNIKPKHSVYPKGQGRDLPSWIAFDKQVLCFEAYFEETVPFAQNEKHRIRKCQIYFYLEDDTIQVVETQYKNSGLPQGTLIRRHRVPLPPPKDDQFYNVYDFNLNQQMVLYSRTFTLTNCDTFTRNFLTKLGVQLNEPINVPDDPYSNLRKQWDEMNPLHPYERRDTLKQFLDHDRELLRFYCYWDDSESACGDLRELILLYFLADDTIEILEVIPPNSGRDARTKFLHRSKLPKTGTISEEFYKDCDLAVGGEVNVWGRRVVLADCDDFTKQHYRSKYGIEDFTPVQYKVPPAPELPKPVPPFNGFGSEEDSLQACLKLLPKPPRKDFNKFMEKDRCGLNSNALTFRAKMTTDTFEAERVFFISFHLCDDTMSVVETPQKNSGMLGGRFLERRRMKKPGQELFKSEPSEYFTAQDLYVGASIYLCGKVFQLLDADEYTLNYMEQHAEEFPKANIGNILSKLRSIPEGKQAEVRKFLALGDPGNTGLIPYQSFRSFLMGLDCGLTEHEVLVVSRCFSERKQPEEDVGLMLAVAQDFLKRKSFQELHELARAFRQRDRQKTGRLSTKETRNICKAFKLPLPEKLLEDLLSKFADEDKIDYNAFHAGINWEDHCAPQVMPEDVLRFVVNTRPHVDGAALETVNYSTLLQDVFSSTSSNSDPTTSS